MSHREGTEDTEEYDGPLLCSGECGVQQQAERQGAPATGDGNWAGAGDPMSSIHLSESAIDWGEAHLCRSGSHPRPLPASPSPEIASCVASSAWR